MEAQIHCAACKGYKYGDSFYIWTSEGLQEAGGFKYCPYCGRELRVKVGERNEIRWKKANT